MIACVEKTEHNADFHQIVDYLTGCSINYSLLVDPDLVDPWLQQFCAYNFSRAQLMKSSYSQAMVAGKKGFDFRGNHFGHYYSNDADCISSREHIVESTHLGLQVLQGILKEAQEAKHFSRQTDSQAKGQTQEIVQRGKTALSVTSYSFGVEKSGSLRNEEKKQRKKVSSSQTRENKEEVNLSERTARRVECYSRKDLNFDDEVKSFKSNLSNLSKKKGSLKTVPKMSEFFADNSHLSQYQRVPMRA
ncbi:hypothetical protein Tco_0574034 [Tanacetum coccineum]